MSEDHSTAALISFLGLVLVSALLSAAFSAVMNARKQHLRELISNGNRRAVRALALGEDATNLLALRQMTAMLLHFGAAAVLLLGAQSLLRALSSEGLLYAVSVGLLLLLGALIMLIFGELIPSALAAKRAEQAAMRWAPLLAILMRLLAPLSA